VTIDGTSVAKHNFGTHAGIKYAVLSGTFMPAASGLYDLYIENTCKIDPTEILYNYIDNITIKPEKPVLDIEDINISCQTGGTATFDIKMGLANKNKEYWLWMSATGNHPGFKLSGLKVPLNWDVLLEFGLLNPGFPGSNGLIGKLDFFGMAQPELTLPPDPQLMMVGLPINFALVLTSPGHSLPITFVSVPVHIKYVP
jgi:hypothetical protein